MITMTRLERVAGAIRVCAIANDTPEHTARAVLHVLGEPTDERIRRAAENAAAAVRAAFAEDGQ